MLELLGQWIGFFLHLDDHLLTWTQTYGNWVYAILFVIIFCETGLVVTPFLPGDSLLFVVGTLTAAGSLQLSWALGLLSLAAILGDTVNYWLGHLLAPKVFQPKYQRIFKPEYLQRTQRFFEKYGGKTIIIARFLPIVRTFAPFLAGVGRMNYWHFLLYNVAGGLLWIFSLVLAGFFFGNIPFVKDNLTVVILIIIFLSFIPGIWEYWQHKKASSLPKP